MLPLRTTALSSLFLLLLAAPVWADTMAPVALNSLSAAPNIAAAQVLDQQGKEIGSAARIQTDQDGKPAALAFRAARDGSTVVISAAAVSFDGRALVASSDQPQVAALAGLRTAAAN